MTDGLHGRNRLPSPAEVPEYATMSPEARRYLRLGFALQVWAETGNQYLDAQAMLAQDQSVYGQPEASRRPTK